MKAKCPFCNRLRVVYRCRGGDGSGVRFGKHTRSDGSGLVCEGWYHVINSGDVQELKKAEK